MVELADGLTQGRGDGRISLSDARTLLRAVKDSNSYSDTEKQTMQYIRRNYRFTKEADAYFRTEIRKWAGSKTQKAAPKAQRATVAKPASQGVNPTESTALASAMGGSEVPQARRSVWKEIVGIILLLAILTLLFWFLTRAITCKSATAPQPTQVTEKPKSTESAQKSQTPVSGELKAFVEKQRLHFKSNTAVLTAASNRTLDSLAKRLKAEPATVRITGHSCALGAASTKQQISEERASVVKTALIARGVPADQIQTVGLSDKEPVADNKAVAGRVANRRVTFSVITP